MFRIKTYNTLNSTNKFALSDIENIEDKTIIRAKTQSSGRGRFNRKWISDKENNCYISFVLKPDKKYLTNLPNLTQYMSIVLCTVLEKYNIKSNIKWPNDVQINGKKIAGILSEASFKQGEFKGIVLGTGVNLNLEYEDLQHINIPATSLNLELNKKIDDDKFINNLCEEFFLNYETFLEKGFKEFRSKYISKCMFLGKEIQIKNPELQFSGTALNICDNGNLEILLKSGEVKKIISGDINL